MKPACLSLLAVLGIACTESEIKLNVVHFADYHSHAVPFYSEHMPDQAGVARTIGYLRRFKDSHENSLILSGGDTINAGTPSWSDKYRCAEWPWFNGLLDAMAFGNHDVDYGWDAFNGCRGTAAYPVLSANMLVGGAPIFTADRQGPKTYLVKDIGGVRVGIFAIAGPDFGALVKKTNLPAGLTFADTTATARQIVDALRNTEQVQAVLFIGHQDRDSDFAMARAVPGIDVVLGTHSHYKGEFQQIPGTSTYFISPFQYLNYVSEVELTFSSGKLTGVTGKLVKMDAGMVPDPETATRVAQMEKDLMGDPAFASRFMVIGQAAVELSNENIDRGESVLGNFIMDIFRRAAGARLAISTASSFRATIPPGPIRMEDYHTAVPYPNQILIRDLTGAQIQQLLDFSIGKRASDNFGVTSGVTYTISGGKAADVAIIQDPAGASYESLDPLKSYPVCTTNYLANVAAGYKDLFMQGQNPRDPMLGVDDVVIDYIRKNSPVSARLEGRIKGQP